MAEAGQVGAGGRALAVVARGRAQYGAMQPRKRTWLTAGMAGLVAVALGMAWFAGRPDWRVLFSGLEGKDVQQVSQELAAAGIPFEATPDGTGVQVPADQLDKARMEVAAKGMPQTGRLGFELFDKPNWVGSEFDERVNYQRALEGELEHTIATLGVVRSARVHLVLPQASLFAGAEKVAKASVVLKLKRTGMEKAQTESIRNLVAGAVENLSPEQVTLVDADGKVNLQMAGRGAEAGEAEQGMEAKLVAMMEPLAGAGNVRATVNVSYIDASEERTDEVYDPAGSVATSVQKTEQTSGVKAAAQGVPGTASNSPAAAQAGSVAGSQAASAPGMPPLLQKEVLPVWPGGSGGGQTQSSKEESGTYAVTKHVSHTEAGPGRVRRVTAAVVVNDRMTSEGVGATAKTVWKTRTTEEMHRLEGLAQAAVGFDEKRGDQLVMENVSFSSNVPEVQAAGMGKVMDEAKGLLGAQPGLVKTGVMGVLGLLIVMFVMRPVAGQVVASLREPAMLTAGGGAVSAVGGGSSGAGLGSGEDEGDPARLRQGRKSAGGTVVDQVSEHIRREPVQSTRLLETWISAEDED